MKLSFIGCGYVGLVSGACFADLGNDVTCVDIDKEKISKLKKGKIPIYEKGLEEIVKRNYKDGRLSFSSDIKDGIIDKEVIFISVGTPSKENGEADLESVYNVASDIGKYMENYKIVVTKSTVPVGTSKNVEKIIKENQSKKISFSVVSNPEFLKEGSAINDFLYPDRIVVGVKDKDVIATEVMKELYSTLVRTGNPIIITDISSSELSKYASNAMLAARISFVNQLSWLCEKTGADIRDVAHIMGTDKRIGPSFLHAGPGYGGSCFPKDVKALAQTMESHGINSDFIRTIDYVNKRQKKSIVEKLKYAMIDKEEVYVGLSDKLISIWGLSFKPGTDDIRESAALVMIDQLLDEKAKINVYDPIAMDNVRSLYNDKINYSSNMYDAIKDADALIVATEWGQFRNPDFDKMRKLMKGHVILDARNIYEPRLVRTHGFLYKGIGR